MAEWDTFMARVQSFSSSSTGGGSAGAGAGTEGAGASAGVMSITYDMMPWIGPPPSVHSSHVALLLHDLGVRTVSLVAILRSVHTWLTVCTRRTVFK